MDHEKLTLLPVTERNHLALLLPRARNSRLARLAAHGWTLASLGASLDPPRPRTTVHYWVQNATELTPIASAYIPPEPPLPDPPHPRRFPNTRTRGISPRIPEDVRPTLASLAASARRYRAKTPPGAAPAIANASLTEIALRYRDLGVPTADIADAAGVSYRAMARRISRATS
jgi:hypothetical protein